MAKAEFHALIYSYLKKYQEDPTSRVFAPLAEAYRKAGLIDEAIEISRDGLKLHPRFIGGRVALARALFDKSLYHEVIAELAPIVEDIPDNLVAQRLLAESYLMLGKVAESLNAYKMLLYFAPTDLDTARIVQELEGRAYAQGALLVKQAKQGNPGEPGTLSDFNIQSAQQAIPNDPSQQRMNKIKKIEALQRILQKVERYRTLRRFPLPSSL